MKKTNDKISLRNVYLLILAIGVLLAAGQIYFLNELTKSFEKQVNEMDNKFQKELSDAISEFDKGLGIFKSDINMQIITLKGEINSLKAKSEEDIDTLTGKIKDVERESSEKFGNLESRIQSSSESNIDNTEIIKEALKSTVSVLTNLGQGSGAIIDPDGFIVTNYHVVSKTRQIKVLTYDGEFREARVIGYNSYKDLALLKIEGGNLEYFKYGDSNKLSAGQKVFALGNPGGLDFTVTQGIISNPDREPKEDLHYLQVDVPINPGNSGGPLVDSKGDLIGINNFKLSGFESLGFALHSNLVKETTDELIRQYEETATN